MFVRRRYQHGISTRVRYIMYVRLSARYVCQVRNINKISTNYSDAAFWYAEHKLNIRSKVLASRTKLKAHN